MSILTRRLAAIFSCTGHPLVFVTISVGIVLMTRHVSRAAPLLIALFLAVIAPTGVLLLLGVRSGRWRDADVSVREERRRFYPIAIPLSALGTIVMWMAGAPHYILRGGIVTLLLLVVAAITNLWFKISLHAMFASYCAVILFRVNAICGIAALILAALVFWSRLYLQRHVLSEMLMGATLGICGGIATAWWP